MAWAALENGLPHLEELQAKSCFQNSGEGFESFAKLCAASPALRVLGVENCYNVRTAQGLLPAGRATPPAQSFGSAAGRGRWTPS